MSLKKTTITLPVPLLLQVDEVCKMLLGMKRNSFFSIAACLTLVQLSELIPEKKRQHLLDDVETLFRATLDHARRKR